MLRRKLDVLWALLLACCLAGLVFSQVDLHADMADFLPGGQTPASRFMLEELRSGTAARVILIGIEGSEPAALARISKAMTGALQASGRFTLVDDGASGFGGGEEAFLADHRYLLAADVDFGIAALHRDFQALLEGLASSAAPLLTRYGFRDPPGAMLAVLGNWVGGSHVHLREGVWFAADRPRALVLAQTGAEGMDIAGQQQVADAIDAAFAAAEPGPARLLVAGPAIFALQAAHVVRGDLEFISVLSTVLIVALLYWRFRSLLVLAAIAVPIVLSVSAAALAVQLVYGFVHGITLGFGITMLGVTVDYPVLLIGHRRPGEPAQGTLDRIGQTLVLTVVAATLGLTGMLFSGFPGLAQLGLFAVVGVAGAALATRFLLPALIVAADLAPVSTGAPQWLLRLEQVRRRRGWFVLPVVAAMAYLVAVGGPLQERDLGNLSPVPEADRARDTELRGELGAPEVGQIMVVSGPDQEAVLQREEALSPVLDRLIASHVLDGAEVASRYLPSIKVQLSRIAAIPADLGALVAQASEGMPFRPDAFAPFVAEAGAEARLAPVTEAELPGLIGARVGPLLFRRGAVWYGLIAPVGVHDPQALATALGGQPDLLRVDIKAETDGLVARYTGQAWRWLGLGGAAALAALLVGLRGMRGLPRVVGPILGAVLLTLAVLRAAGVALSLFHLVALQLMVGVALDYALFFARRGLDGEERARTFRTLITCNAMTLLSFGLLAFCRTPLLRGIGLTVAVGVVGAISLAFVFAGDLPPQEEPSA